jgi:hypothetical protein
MRFRGHPVVGAIFGFLFFLFVATDLLFFAVIPLNSPLVTILPIVGIVVGLLWAYWAPLGKRGGTPPVATEPAAPSTGDAPPPATEPQP